MAHTPLFQIASPMRRSALRPQSFRQRMAVLHLLHPKILSCTHQLHGGTVDCACAPGHGPSLQQQRLLDFCCGTGRWQRLRSDPDLSGAQLQQTDILPCDATYPMRICQQSDICLLAIPSHSQKGELQEEVIAKIQQARPAERWGERPKQGRHAFTTRIRHCGPPTARDFYIPWYKTVLRAFTPSQGTAGQRSFVPVRTAARPMDLIAWKRVLDGRTMSGYSKLY